MPKMLKKILLVAIVVYALCEMVGDARSVVAYFYRFPSQILWPLGIGVSGGAVLWLAHRLPRSVRLWFLWLPANLGLTGFVAYFAYWLVKGFRGSWELARGSVDGLWWWFPCLVCAGMFGVVVLLTVGSWTGWVLVARKPGRSGKLPHD